MATIDFEASALPGPGSFPIEVGICFVDDGRSRSWVIRPTDEWIDHGLWNTESQAVHGLELGQLMAIGQDVTKVAAEIEHELDGFTAISDFPVGERFWARGLFDAAGLNWRTTVGSVYNVYDDLGAKGSEIERAQWASHAKFPKVHSAESDARRLALSIRILAGLDRL